MLEIGGHSKRGSHVQEVASKLHKINATCKELTSNSHKSAIEEFNVGRRGEEEIYT
jgi:hypothetical protein